MSLASAREVPVPTKNSIRNEGPRNSKSDHFLSMGPGAARPANALPLGPIRSLHYFLPVIEELLVHPLPQAYVAYLRSKVDQRPATRHATGVMG